jgi:hypothetical protein
MKYVKLDLSFMDRIRFLFLGVIPEERLPEVEVIREVEKITEKHFNTTTHPTDKPVINTNEEEESFVIPFFDLQDNDTKSNF